MIFYNPKVLIFGAIIKDRWYFPFQNLYRQNKNSTYILEVGIYSIWEREYGKRMGDEERENWIVLKVWEEFFKSLTTQT